MRKLTIIAYFVFIITACHNKPELGLITEKAMVVSARVEASEIGSSILKKRGMLMMQWLLHILH